MDSRRLVHIIRSHHHELFNVKLQQMPWNGFGRDSTRMPVKDIQASTTPTREARASRLKVQTMHRKS